jgi:hypothetical protein
MSFENEIVNALNFFYIKNQIKAQAYRLYQAEFSPGQHCDIVSDSANSKYYLALECKTMNSSKYKTFNFKSRTSQTDDGIHQFEREFKFAERTGRRGFLLIELRMGAGKPKMCYFIPMKDAFETRQSGKKSYKLSEIQSYPSLSREKGKYVVEDSIFD